MRCSVCFVLVYYLLGLALSLSDLVGLLDSDYTFVFCCTSCVGFPCFPGPPSSPPSGKEDVEQCTSDVSCLFSVTFSITDSFSGLYSFKRSVVLRLHAEKCCANNSPNCSYSSSTLISGKFSRNFRVCSVIEQSF